jgi:hypothetical protein
MTNPAGNLILHIEGNLREYPELVLERPSKDFDAPLLSHGDSL